MTLSTPEKSVIAGSQAQSDRASDRSESDAKAVRFMVLPTPYSPLESNGGTRRLWRKHGNSLYPPESPAGRAAATARGWRRNALAGNRFQVCCEDGARDGTRTRNPLRGVDFKSTAYTISPPARRTNGELVADHSLSRNIRSKSAGSTAHPTGLPAPRLRAKRLLVERVCYWVSGSPSTGSAPRLRMRALSSTAAASITAVSVPRMTKLAPYRPRWKKG
jgi:hypothetical protein